MIRHTKGDLNMKTALKWIAIFVITVSFAACDNDGHDHGDHKDGDKTGHKHGDGHDHKDGDGHDHKDGDGHEAHGTRVELGKADVGGFSVTVAVLGEIKAGAEGVLDIKVEGDTDPSVLRAWVGVESGEGSLKAKLGKEGDDYHGHVEVPATMPEGSAVWVEIEDAEGKKSSASFKLAVPTAPVSK